MNVIRHIHSRDLLRDGCVLTIGNFDAIHLGHQRILARLRERADELDLPLVVMTFDPHPEEYFRGDRSAARLTDRTTRFFALQSAGVDTMLLVRFDEQLAETSAETFIAQYLVGALNVHYLLIGDDFRFGKDRAGDFTLLQEAAARYGFTVDNTRTIVSDGSRISSTRIRALLANGELDGAAALLGRHYNLVGRVTYGQQLGRQWGFPTLNLKIDHKPALTGVFAVNVLGLEAYPLPGVANLGKRPTVDGLTTLLEVHLFDFEGSVYGERICVEFVHKIRGEQKFDSFDELKAQIAKDAERARVLLNAGETL